MRSSYTVEGSLPVAIADGIERNFTSPASTSTTKRTSKLRLPDLLPVSPSCRCAKPPARSRRHRHYFHPALKISRQRRPHFLKLLRIFRRQHCQPNPRRQHSCRIFLLQKQNRCSAYRAHHQRLLPTIHKPSQSPPTFANPTGFYSAPVRWGIPSIVHFAV